MQAALIQKVKPTHVCTRRNSFYVLLAEGTHAFTIPLGGVHAFFASQRVLVEHALKHG
jgi:hypothetical protein